MYVKSLEDVVRGYRSESTDKEWAEIAQEHKNEAGKHWKEVERLRKIVDEGMLLKYRMQIVALAEEDKKVPVSVCDHCEETYPESWVVDGLCPFCGHAHNEENKKLIGENKSHAAFCPVCSQYLPDGAGIIEDITVSSGSIQFDLKNALVANLIGRYVYNLLKESGVPNFITGELGDTKEAGSIESNPHRIYVTFGWANKKTPGTVITELRKTIEALEKIMREKQWSYCLSEDDFCLELKESLKSHIGECKLKARSRYGTFPLWEDDAMLQAITHTIFKKAEQMIADECLWIVDHHYRRETNADFVKKLKAEWKHDYGLMQERWAVDGTHVIVELATGGWSANEEIIIAMRSNFVLWGLTWQKSERGGSHTFLFEL
jgi:hypothetical protein